MGFEEKLKQYKAEKSRGFQVPSVGMGLPHIALIVCSLVLLGVAVFFWVKSDSLFIRIVFTLIFLLVTGVTAGMIKSLK